MTIEKFPETQPLYPKLRPLTLKELRNQPKREHILKGVLGAGEFSVFSGEPKCGKSFLVVDLALAMARGEDWFGRAVRQGPVVYIAAEGIGGVPKRIEAYFKHRDLGDEDFPFYPILTGVDLLKAEGDAAGIIYWVNRVAEKAGQPVSMVVIDTLSRTMPGGNENSPEHMTQYIGNCDLIRQETGTHVSAIHHNPKSSTNALRGHSSLFGAIDTHILVEKFSDGNVWKVEASKDDEDGYSAGFKLKVIEVDQDEGEPVTSCVVEPAEVERRRSKAKLSDTEQVCLDALHHAIGKAGKIPADSQNIPAGISCVSITQWEAEAKAKYPGKTEDKKKAFQRGPKGLQGKGRIGVYQDLVWPIHGDFDD
jgi:hypothetical protein